MPEAVPVTIRSPDPDVPPHETIGYAPTLHCHLVVTKAATFDEVAEMWREYSDCWRITHRSTGFKVGTTEWPTRAEALAVLERCDPDFPAWALATGRPDDVATMACRVKFRGAIG